MYVIKVDGQVLWSPALSDDYRILSPSLSLEVNKAGSLSFTLPPGHAMYDAIQKMKSIITVEQDGEEIFRGRALDETTDFYNQKQVYCEGELAFLLDSLQRPYEFEGSVVDFLRMIMKNHNEQVEEAKRFTVGTVNAVDDSVQLALENIGYSDTLTALESVLLDVYEGYFRIRYEGGVRYLDYVYAYGENSAQKIQFGVNMLDLDNQLDAKEIFTVLVPLGGINKDGETITIESVNEGLDYIENADAIAQYGRIVKTHSWEDVTDPAELYELGYKKLMKNTTADTLTIKAVDLHLLNGDTDKISLGDNVHLLSAPHGLDKEYTCEGIDINIFDPEKTVYTFGPKIDTMADNAASMANLVKKHSHDLYCHLRHIKELEKAVTINITNYDDVNNRISSVALEMDAISATVALKASQYSVDEMGYRLDAAEIAIDGANSAIKLKADATAVSSLETRVRSAEIAIDGANAQIALKVSKDGVISSINQTAEEVTIKASKINLSGYVTTSKLEAKLVDVGFVDAGRLEVGQFASNYADLGQTTIGRLKLAGKTLSTTSGTFVTAVTLPTVSTDYITYMDENMDVVQQKVVTGFYQGSVTSGSLNYVSHYTTS